MEEAHAQGLEHEALAAHAVKKNAAVLGGNGGEFGDQKVQWGRVWMGGL